MKLPRDLPDVELNRLPVQAVSSSPAPGRPGHEPSCKRGRESSGSETGQHTPKSQRKDVSETIENIESDKATRQKAWRECVENVERVIEGAEDLSFPNKNADHGKFTSVQGTPVKSVSSLDYLASPILSKYKKQEEKI